MLAGTTAGGETAVDAPRLLLTEGGPGAAVLRRLKPASGRRRFRVAVVLAAVTWVPLLVLSIGHGLLVASAEGSFLRDLSAHVRLLVALPVLVLAEIPIGASLGGAIARFADAGLVRPHERGRFAEILAAGARLRDSRVAEVVVLVAACLTSHVLLTMFRATGSASWFGPGPAGRPMTSAGLWYAFVSLPILHFLVFRWLFLIAVWARLLRRLSRLDLRLTPAHPDGAGGLGFLGECSVPFGLLLFAASAVLVSEDAGRILFAGAGLEVFQWGYPALFIVALAIFLGPLLVFLPGLLKLRMRGLHAYGVFGSAYARRFDETWIEGGDADEPSHATREADVESLAALAETYGRIRGMRAVPVARGDLLALALPGLGPLLLLAAATVPGREVARSLLRLVV